MRPAPLLLLPLSLCLSAVEPGPRSGPVVFPASGVVDLSQAPYSAKGDGSSDCTATLQKALEDHANSDRIIYLPAGTWMISDTVKWGAGKRGGLEQKRIILQGAGADRTILRLKDASPGFQQPIKEAKGGESYKAMLWTGKAPAQRFRNGIRDLTVDIGKGNPAATAIQYIANNQGSLRDVRITAPAGEGSIGLDLGYTNEQGPCLIQRVRVEGFRTGIRLTGVVDSVTMHQIALVGQREAGISNEGQVLSIEDLHARLDAPAIINRHIMSFLTLDGAQLQGGGAKAKSGPAIRSTGYLAVRNLRAEGWACAIEQGQEPKKPDPKAKPSATAAAPPPPPVQVQGPVDEWYSHAPDLLLGAAPKALRLVPEATPVEPLPGEGDWASPAEFGGNGEDDLDDTAALQQAVDSGKRAVYLPQGGKWRLDGELLLRGKVELFTACEGRLTGTGCLVAADGEAKAVHIARLDLIYQQVRIEQRSGRPLVLSGITMGKGHFSWTGTGPVHLEDVCMGTLTVPAGGKAWARQLNIETKGGHKILVDGGQLRILGYKTEQHGICCEVRAGGQAEIVGGFIYAQGAAKDSPMLICRDSDLSASLAEVCWNFGKQGYGTLAEAWRGEQKEVLAGGSAAGRHWHSNGASAVPLLRAGR